MEPSIRIAEERNPSFCLSAGKPISSTVNPYLISSYLIALHYYYASYLSVVFKSVSTSPTNNYNNNCYPVATRISFFETQKPGSLKSFIGLLANNNNYWNDSKLPHW